MEEPNRSDIDEDESYSIIDRLADAIRLEGEAARLKDSDSIVQQLWEGPRKCQCCINWIDEMPQGIEIKPVEDIDESYQLIIRHRVLAGEEKRHISIHSIEVRDAKVREVLMEVFQGLDGITPDIKCLIFLAPFRQFFWRWEKFEVAIEDQLDNNVKSVLTHLRAIVRQQLAEAFAATKELVSNGFISHKYAWTLFPPGELIYEDRENRFFVVDVCDIDPTNGGCNIDSSFVNWDGVQFGAARRVHRIRSFRGTRKITDIEAYPAKYVDNLESVKQACIERGRKFRSLAGIHYKSYRGSTTPTATYGSSEARGSSAHDSKHDLRIILDASGHFANRRVDFLMDSESLGKHYTGLIVQAPLDATPPGGHKPLRRTSRRRDRSDHEDEDSDLDLALDRPPLSRIRIRERYRGSFSTPGVISQRPTPGFHHSPTPEPITPLQHHSFGSPVIPLPNEDNFRNQKQRLTDFQLLLCNSKLLGYCLKEKEWRSFEVTRISDIEWNNEPFESLVLPDGYKDLIVSFVDNQLRDGDTFDDVINGKGGGLILLLAGDPGVGKTLTAESVAEKMHAPLYKMDLGQLEHDLDPDMRIRSGRVEDSPEDKIKTAFKLAAKWKAVLLIDECDMYLEKRSDASPARNRIVNRFLQELEYYPSLLFLTTNREKVLDPAIYSRIHLTINYPALDTQSRRQIWSTFLARTSSAVSATELDVLAGVQLNGRRIRNIVKTAGIMTKQQQRAICFDDVKSVIRITEGIVIEIHDT
ncbi:26S proteasome regulatory subunit [Paramyrothecium foliicola]|nr:26S proteasome regulatory subunit [Paramyrothecium foliicola]